jgi:hypothetical protein
VAEPNNGPSAAQWSMVARTKTARRCKLVSETATGTTVGAIRSRSGIFVKCPRRFRTYLWNIVPSTGRSAINYSKPSGRGQMLRILALPRDLDW